MLKASDFITPMDAVRKHKRNKPTWKRDFSAWSAWGDENAAYGKVSPAPNKQPIVMITWDAMLQRAFSVRHNDAKDATSPMHRFQCYVAQTWLDTLNLPRTPEDPYANHSIVIRDKKQYGARNKDAPVLLLDAGVPGHVQRKGRAKKSDVIKWVAVGTDQQIANQNAVLSKQLAKARKQSKKMRRRLSTSGRQGRMTPQALEQAVDALNEAAKSLGMGHVMFVEGVRKGNHKRSHIRDKATVLMHLLRAKGGVAALKVEDCKQRRCTILQTIELHAAGNAYEVSFFQLALECSPACQW